MNELIARLPQMEREADELERKAHALRQIIAGVRALNGDAEAILSPRFLQQNGKVYVARPLDEQGPRGRKAVQLVMSEEPDREWKVDEVKREMLRRGWAPSPKAVEATVKRMRDLGELVPGRYGYYKLAPNGVAELVVPMDAESNGGEVRQ